MRTTIDIDAPILADLKRLQKREAALLRQHGVRRLYSSDRDFRKFDFLEVRNPFD